MNYSGEPYNAVDRRKGAQLFYIMGGNKVAAPNKAKGMTGAAASGKIYSGKSSGTNNIGVPPASQAAVPKKFGSSMGVGSAGNSNLEQQVEELKQNNDTLDREREFYFGKLRDIEEMLQKRGLDQDALGSEVLKILYASEEEHVEVDEKGQLTIT